MQVGKLISAAAAAATAAAAAAAVPIYLSCCDSTLQRVLSYLMLAVDCASATVHTTCRCTSGCGYDMRVELF